MNYLHFRNVFHIFLHPPTTDRRHSYHHKRLMSKNSNRNVTAELVVTWSGLVGDPRTGGGRGDLMLLLLLRGFLHDCVCRAVCLTNNPGQYFIFRSSRVPIYLGRCIDSSTQLHTAITSLSRFPSLHSGCSRVLPGTGALLIVGSFYRKVDCPVVKYLCYI